MPLTVTERASAMLKRLLDTWPHERGQVLRLVSDLRGDPQGEMSFELDTKREGDQVVKHNRAPVMVIERSLSEGLGHLGITLDVERSRQPDGRWDESLTLLRDLPLGLSQLSQRRQGWPGLPQQSQQWRRG